MVSFCEPALSGFMLQTLESFFSSFSVHLGYPLLVLLLGTHLFLTIRLRFIQRYLPKALKLYAGKEKGRDGDISQFSSLCVALAATIGTGNIVGVATAVAVGGPGAVFWCWITGVLGMATKYGEGLLAVKYRVQTRNGTMAGGPMYALERGLGQRWLAVLFCVFTAIAAFGIGNVVQGNAAAELVYKNFNIPTVYTGLFLTVLVGIVMLGGIKSIGRFCSWLVPFMALFYIVGCLYILAVQHAALPETFRVIFSSAFTPQAAGGGFVGATVITAIRMGVGRGLFSNESGMGSAPIAAAAARTRNSVRQALISSTGTFWDTVVVCALTGLVIVSSIIANPNISYADGNALTHSAFNQIPHVGGTVLTLALLTFVISTLMGWSYYGEKAMEYLCGQRSVFPYRVVWVVAVFVGAVVKSELVWSFADCANALMAFPNLVCLLGLSGVIVAETRHYLWGGRLDEREPQPPVLEDDDDGGDDLPGEERVY